MNSRPQSLPSILALLILLTTVDGASITHAQSKAASASNTAPDPAVTAAVYQFKQCQRIHRDGKHLRMLAAIRKLKDPALKPFYAHLADSNFAAMKIHGFLGLAESESSTQLDLTRLGTVKDEAMRRAIISSALDAKLLASDQALTLYDWKGLDSTTKILLAMPLVQDGKLKDLTALRKAGTATDVAGPELGKPNTDTPAAAPRGLANLLLVQLGDKGAMARLQSTLNSDDAQALAARRILLQAVMRYEYDKAGPWALQIASREGIQSQVGTLALRTALRFNVPGAAATWTEGYAQAKDDIALRMRMALVLLHAAAHLKLAVHQPMLNDADPFLRIVGQTIDAVVRKQKIAHAVAALIKQDHPIANAWALSYAKNDADVAIAVPILLTTIQAFDGPEQGRGGRLDAAVLAVQILHERSTKTANAVLRPLLADSKTDPLLAMGIVMGLHRSTGPRPHDLVTGVSFSNIKTQQFALLLRAKRTAMLGEKLSADDLNQLALLVRGGGSLAETLRIQAAWSYLKLTGQTDVALQAAMAN